MILHDLRVRPIQPAEVSRFQQLMQTHHYLGVLPKIGETLWYVTTWQTDWVALLSCFGRCLEMCGSGPLDRVAVPPPIRSLAFAGQQQPVSHPAHLASA